MDEVDFTRGHSDPTVLPDWMFSEWPLEAWGYAASAYLAGVQVGLAQPAPVAADSGEAGNG